MQQTANVWLQDFQKQQVAWTVAAELLKETSNTYVFFGAHTLCKYICFLGCETCSKIRYDFNELSTEQAQQLFSMLFSVAQQYKENRTTLRNDQYRGSRRREHWSHRQRIHAPQRSQHAPRGGEQQASEFLSSP